VSGIEVALIATAAMLVGYASGRRRVRVDAEIVAAEGWHQHVHSALFVARRTLGPDYEITQEVRP
jgi:hypothetical protein